MLCDLPGVLSFLGLPPETEMPPGNKGKMKLKKLYRKVAPNKAYHSGERASSRTPTSPCNIGPESERTTPSSS